MSDFLSREKEFLKFNEELNKKTKSALEKNIESTRTISPRSGGKNLNNRRASIEVDKLNLRTSSRASSIKNSSLTRPESKRKSPQNSKSPPPNSPILSKVDNASQTTSRTQSNSRNSSPKHEIMSSALTNKTSEKPPIKPKGLSQTKASTVPRNFRNVLNSNKSVVERELHKINAKLDERAKMALAAVKENIEKQKIDSKETSPLRDAHGPKNKTSPRTSLSPPLLSGRKTPSTISKRIAKTMTETYRNNNFRESPSTESLVLKPNSPTSETRSTTTKSEVTSRTRRDITVASLKKPLRSQPTTSDPVTKKNVSTDGLIKYLKSKLSIIEMELEDNMSELKKKSDELHASYEAHKKLEIQRDQAISKNNSLTEQLSKMEEKLVSVERKLKDKESELTAATRELESVRREVRVLTQANANLEKRLYKANEELENAKNNITSMKEAERELKESARQEKEAQDRQIKTLKKQRSELLAAYKKQLYLIDNLRRQNICMEQSRMVSFGEKEFTKVLEWNMQN